MSLDDAFPDHVNLLANEVLDRLGSYKSTLKDGTILDQIRSYRIGGSLTIVMGAGVSMPSRIPGWKDLIRTASKDMFKGRATSGIADLLFSSHLSPISQVRFLETVLGLKAAFRTRLLEALYGGYLSSAPTADNLTALADFILGPGESPVVRAVITYNFDNLLEIALRESIRISGRSIDIHEVYSRETYECHGEGKLVRVFHPHGYLPFGENPERLINIPIVFSEEDYHLHFRDSAYWANVAQMWHLYSVPCLFIGLSFSDPSLRRLLDYTSQKNGGRHIAIKAVETSFSADENALRNLIFEKDLESLGVQTLWIEQNSDIPQLLRDLTKP